MQPLPTLADDGLIIPDVGEWGEEKYQLVRCYAQVFASSMKNKWEQRVYIDLFAGAGRALVRDSKRIVPASPLLALGINDPFDRYIFCELSEKKLSALKVRQERDYSDRDARYVLGDSNTTVAKTLSHIPKHSPSNRVLTFCFIDPFNLDNLKFSTIEQLAAGGRLIDFLILIPTGMDASRNQHLENTIYAEFLGNPAWRADWEKERMAGRPFMNFFVDEFARSMQRIGYRWDGFPTAQAVRNEKNSPIYHLVFFSRHPLAATFWQDCREYASLQRQLRFS